MQTFLVAIYEPTWKVPSSKEMQFTQGCMWYRRVIVDRRAAQQQCVCVCVSTKRVKRRQGERAYMLIYALVCMCVRQCGQYWHAIFWAHGAAAARPRVLRFLQHLPLWWPVSAQCHPDSTSANMLKPLFYWTAANRKRRTPLSLQSALKTGARAKRQGLWVQLP